MVPATAVAAAMSMWSPFEIAEPFFAARHRDERCHPPGGGGCRFVGRQFRMDGPVPHLGESVPRWYGETVGFWHDDTLITWTSTVAVASAFGGERVGARAA